MASDLIENYEGNPALKFISDVPLNWETSKVVDAAIGEYIVVARKDIDSEDWYLGAITNEESREFTINLDFLEEGKSYTAQIYRDADDSDYEGNPEAFLIEEIPLKKGDEYTLKLARGGGQAVRFKADE
jgi:alpha-glucosidase